jgi:tetratricopeptide (TPR) repeat protein
MRLRGVAVAACAVAALAAAAAGAQDARRQRFSRAEYVELVRRYARGERAAALAGLGAWSERDLARQLASVEQAARAAERCPSCPNSLEGFPLRAAAMLHWDRDRAEQAPPDPGEVEQLRRCAGPLATLAGRFARLMARDAASADFARRFLRMVVWSCQWDACFEQAERWASEAIELLPRDAELLLARGSVREEVATLGWRSPPQATGWTAATPAAADRVARRDGFGKARLDFEAALAVEPGLGLARVRLGRVLWRLGEPRLAREQLEVALARLDRPDHVYLARLFLGRLHQDAGQLAEAAAEYRLAAALHPSALSGSVALSNALLVAGDAEGARLALDRGLASAGRRRERDPHWDYLVVNAADLAELSDALHREALE